MKLDDNQVATIDLQELHDILAGGNLGVEADAAFGVVLPSMFVLEDSALEEQDRAAVGALMTKLNSLREQIATLDSEFHDIFDGGYC